MEDLIYIRSLINEDVDEFLKLCGIIDSESDNMLYVSGERARFLDMQKHKIIAILNDDRSNIWLAVNKYNEPIGYLIAIGNNLIKTQHTVYIVIGIIKSYTNRGIGTKLFKELDKWAISNQIHRLELTVRSRNTSAIALYKKMGFEQEGIKRNSLLINSKYEDELYMSKLY